MWLKDNKISILLVKNIENQSQTRYINVIYYYIWKLVEKKTPIK